MIYLIKKKPLKTIFIVFLVALLLEGLGNITGLQPTDFIKSITDLKKTQTKITENHSPQILTSTKNSKFSWEKTNTKHNKISFNELDSRLVKYLALASLKNALEKYPKSIIKNNINFIYAVSHINYYGTNISGLYDYKTKSIIVSTKSSTLFFNRSKISIEATFHHEASSFLLKNYNFNELKWRTAESENFFYKTDKNPFYFTTYIQGDESKTDKKTLYNRGLLTQYAETGVENDFNIYASKIFTEPKKMKLLIKKYPVIKRKYEIFKEFYLGIDSDFIPVFKKIDS